MKINLGEKVSRPGKDTTHAAVSRKEFDDLIARIVGVEQALLNLFIVPGFSVIPDPQNPGDPDYVVDAKLCHTWNEDHMVVVGDSFGLNLREYRGKPKVMREKLYDELRDHNIRPEEPK